MQLGARDDLKPAGDLDHLQSARPLVVAAQRIERGAASRIWIREQRARAGSRFVVERNHVRAVARECVALRAAHRLRLLRMALRETGVEVADQRNVEAVHPDHRLASGIAVVVPRARRRDDEVTRAHRRALAVDRRIRAFAFDDEAQRGLRVTMRRRDLARHDELQAAKERARNARLAAQARILEDENAALRFLRRHEPAGLEHVRSHRVVAPERRHAGRPRLGNHEVAEHIPERCHVLRADQGVERLAFRRRAWRFVHPIGLRFSPRHAFAGCDLVTRPMRVQSSVETILVCSKRRVAGLSAIASCGIRFASSATRVTLCAHRRGVVHSVQCAKCRTPAAGRQRGARRTGATGPKPRAC